MDMARTHYDGRINKHTHSLDPTGGTWNTPLLLAPDFLVSPVRQCAGDIMQHVRTAVGGVTARLGPNSLKLGATITRDPAADLVAPPTRMLEKPPFPCKTTRGTRNDVAAKSS
jgi:hypothetical protein